MFTPKLFLVTTASCLSLAGLASAQAPAAAQAATETSARPNNYGDANTWLCRPGRQDACAIDLATTSSPPTEG